MTDLPKIRINADAHQVWVGDQTVHLPLKAYQVLAELARRPGKAVPTAELLQAVWPQGYVTVSVLQMQVSTLRRALGGRGYIDTIHGVGYRFEPDVLAEPLLPPEPPAPVADGETLIELGHLLRDTMRNLQRQIDHQAEKTAAARIADAERRVADAEHALADERQLREDLAAELRRRIRALEQQLERKVSHG